MSPQIWIRNLSIVLLAAAAVACGTPAYSPPESADPDDASGLYDAESETAVAPAGNPQAPVADDPVTAPTPAPRPTRDARPAPEAPAPPPPPAPAEPVTMVVPAGTRLDVTFLDSVSSEESQPGDPVRVRVVNDIMQDDIAVVPAGSVVVGTVTEAVSLKKIGGKARLGVEFTTLELTSGRTTAIHAAFAEAGKSETKKDAATIGGATAGGALLGRMIEKDDKSKGTLIGAVVGAAAGTAIAAKTKGEEVLITSGTRVDLELTQPATITLIP